MIAPTQFRKKPVVISAIQWTGENLIEVIHFTDGRPPNNKSSHAGMMWDQYVDLVRKDGLKIFTMEGKMDASIGDWIIKGVKGEHYPCKPEIFALTYEDALEKVKLSQNILALGDKAVLLVEAMKLPEVAALADAVTQELDARLIYEATPTDRGGNSGPKGTALTNWTRARATVAVVLAPFTAAKETP